jgi:hypothetical protein
LPAILDPEQPFYYHFDRPYPPGQREAEQERRAAEAAAAGGAAGVGESKVAEGAVAAAPAPISLSHSSSSGSVDMDAETAAALGTSFAEQLRLGDSADFRGASTQDTWVTVRVCEISPTDTELRLESVLLPEPVWVSIDDPSNRWAPAGTKASGAPLAGKAAVSDEARRAADEADLVKTLRSPTSGLQERLLWQRGRLCDMRHRVDGLWYQVSLALWGRLSAAFPATIFPARASGVCCGRPAC